MEEKKEVESEFVPEFIQRTISRLEWPVVLSAAEAVGCGGSLPPSLNDETTKDPDFLKLVHHVLLEIDIVNGKLECPETGRIFPIQNSIPNMLLNETEV